MVGTQHQLCLEPRPLELESSALIFRPLHLPQHGTKHEANYQTVACMVVLILYEFSYSL